MADKTHVKKGEIVTTVKEKAKLCCESRKHSNNILDILTLSQVKYITSINEILHTRDQLTLATTILEYQYCPQYWYTNFIPVLLEILKKIVDYGI